MPSTEQDEAFWLSFANVNREQKSTDVLAFVFLNGYSGYCSGSLHV